MESNPKLLPEGKALFPRMSAFLRISFCLFYPCHTRVSFCSLFAILPPSPFCLFLPSLMLKIEVSPHIAPDGLKFILLQGGEVTPLKIIVSKAFWAGGFQVHCPVPEKNKKCGKEWIGKGDLFRKKKKKEKSCVGSIVPREGYCWTILPDDLQWIFLGIGWRLM